MSGPGIGRREALRIGSSTALAVGAFLLAGRQRSVAFAAPTAPLVTKPIPSSGERLPVIGVGTARRRR